MNVDGRFELCIFNMKVRRRVVIEIHPDDKAVEKANGRHDWLGTMKQELKEIKLVGRFVGGLLSLPVE